MLTLIALLSGDVSAATLEVCASCAYTSIQDAVDDAVDGDDVVLMGGTFSEQVTIESSITLRGEWGTTNIIDAYGRAFHRTVHVLGEEVVIRNIEVTNTGVSDDGCEIDNDFARTSIQVGTDSHLTMQRVSITDGCPYIAPVHNFGVLSISNGSLIAGNEAYVAGGIYNRGIIQTWKTSADYSVTIEDNSGGYSGGVFSNDYSNEVSGYTPGTFIRDARFVGNTSTLYGGGVAIFNNSLLVQDSVFEDNTAGLLAGGGWYFYSTDGAVTHSGNSYSGNSAGTTGTDSYLDATTGDAD